MDERDERRSFCFCEGLFFGVFWIPFINQLVMDQNVQPDNSKRSKGDGFF